MKWFHRSARPDDGTDPKGFYDIECLVDLYPKEKWKSHLTKDELIDKMQQRLDSKYVGAVWSFSQPIIDNVNEAVAGINVNQAVKVFGENLDTISKIARQVCEKINPIRGMEDVGILKNLGQPELANKIRQGKNGCIWHFSC